MLEGRTREGFSKNLAHVFYRAPLTYKCLIEVNENRANEGKFPPAQD
jgi:hypothetical protein